MPTAKIRLLTWTRLPADLTPPGFLRGVYALACPPNILVRGVDARGVMRRGVIWHQEELSNDDLREAISGALAEAVLSG